MTRGVVATLLALTVSACSVDNRTLHVGAGGLLCSGTPPHDPLITDFSNLTGIQTSSTTGMAIYLFGTPPAITGGTFTYASAGLSAPRTGAVNYALQVDIDSGFPPPNAMFAYVGVGLFIQMCVDATAYSGVRFTITGDLGNCGMRFGVQSPEVQKPEDSGFGVCTADTCTEPVSDLIATGTTIVPFDQLMGGSPQPMVDKTRITAIAWDFPVPGGTSGGCRASFTIDDVSFVQ